MMNKKGFTLIELLAVIAIIAMISLIAIPNIVGLQDNIKKDQMLDDAKKLISMAKYQVNANYDVRYFLRNANGIICDSTSKSCIFSFDALNINNDVKEDPDSTTNPPSNYLSATVTYTNDGVAKYCVYLEGVRRKVCRSTDCGCVYEENLYSRTNVRDK